MSMIGVGVLAGIGACVGLGATAPVAARRAYRKARARAAQRPESIPLAITHEVMIPAQVHAKRPIEKVAALRVDFRQLEPQHISHVPARELEVTNCDLKSEMFPSGNSAPAPEPTIIEVPVEVERIVYAHLPDDLDTYVTVLDVMDQMGVDIKKEITWPVGREARRAHIAHYGVPPRSITRGKTRSGGGTHAYAGYPPEFVPTLKGLIADEVSRETQGA